MVYSELLKEAFHSYQLYIQCSGVLDVHQAKLSLLLWPDIAHTALEMVERPGDKSLKEVLIRDLKLCIVKPVQVIHDSTLERVKQVTGKYPAKSKTVKDIEITNDPVEAKKKLLRSINRMFVTLNTLTNVEYPVLSKVKQ